MRTMLASKAIEINNVIQYLSEFDHIEGNPKFRVIKQTIRGKEYKSKEYLIHYEPGYYYAILVYKNKDGSIEYYDTKIKVYKKSNSAYFAYTLPDEFETQKRLILVLLKSADK